MYKLLYEVLEKIRIRHGLFIGNKSIEKLAMFINGFECASMTYESDKAKSTFNFKFQTYIELKLEKYDSKHWSQLLLDGRTEDEAFEMFYKCFDEFKSYVRDENDFEKLLKKHEENFLLFLNNNLD